MRQRTGWTILLASVAYVVVGIGTSMLAGAAVSRTGVQAWRLAAWLLSLVVFGVHLASEHRRQAVASPQPQGWRWQSRSEHSDWLRSDQCAVIGVTRT